MMKLSVMPSKKHMDSLKSLVQPKVSHRGRWILFLLGLDPTRTFWGLKPYDLLWPGRSTEPWYQQVVHSSHSHGRFHHDHSETVFYETPHARLVWGDVQDELHPGTNELFLDLIFVGIAYRAGNSFKYSMYYPYCNDPDGGSSGSSSGSSGSSSGSSGSSSGSSSDSSGSSGSSDSSDSSGSSSASSTDTSGSSSESSGGSADSSASGGRRLGSGSYTADCIGFGLAALHSLSPFVCMHMIWQVETYHKSKFACNDVVHYILDLTGYVLLIITGINSNSPWEYRGSGAGNQAAPNRSIITLTWLCVMWMFRSLEVAVFAKRESSRRQGSADAMALLGVLLFWLGAHFAAYWDTLEHTDSPEISIRAIVGALQKDTASSNSGSSTEYPYHVKDSLQDDVSTALMWAGNLFYMCKLVQRPLLLKLFGDKGMGVEQTMTPSNLGFLIHRCNEFMFLMLGEGVLAMVAAYSNISTEDSAVFNSTTLTAGASFIVVICMCQSFQMMLQMQFKVYAHVEEAVASDIQREDKLQKLGLDKLSWQSAEVKAACVIQKRWRARDKAMAKDTELEKAKEREGKAGRILYHVAASDATIAFLWQANAMAVMLVGIGIKLAIYNPKATDDAFFSFEQRLEFNLSVSIVFFIQLFHTVAVYDVGSYDYESLSKHGTPLCIALVRVLLLVGGFCVSWADMSPMTNSCVQVPFALAQTGLMILYDKNRQRIVALGIDHGETSVYNFMPMALTILRHKVRRFQDLAGIDRTIRSSRRSSQVGHAVDHAAHSAVHAVDHAAHSAVHAVDHAAHSAVHAVDHAAHSAVHAVDHAGGHGGHGHGHGKGHGHGEEGGHRPSVLRSGTLSMVELAATHEEVDVELAAAVDAGQLKVHRDSHEAVNPRSETPSPPGACLSRSSA